MTSTAIKPITMPTMISIRLKPCSLCSRRRRRRVVMAIALVLCDDAGGGVVVRGRFARQLPEDLHLDHAAGLGDRSGKVWRVDLDYRIGGEKRADHSAMHVVLERRVFQAARGAVVVGLE